MACVQLVHLCWKKAIQAQLFWWCTNKKGWCRLLLWVFNKYWKDKNNWSPLYYCTCLNTDFVLCIFAGMVTRIRTNLRRLGYGTDEMVVGLMFTSIVPLQPPIQIHSYWNLPIDRKGSSLAKNQTSVYHHQRYNIYQVTVTTIFPFKIIISSPRFLTDLLCIFFAKATLSYFLRWYRW